MDVAQLAQAGATSIVVAMATDSWKFVRDRMAALLGRDDEARQRLEAEELEKSHLLLVAADEGTLTGVRREVEIELRGLLKARLRDDAGLATELSAFLEEIRERIGAPAPASVHLQATVDGSGTVIQVGRDVIGDVQHREGS
jgi:hypothetical protein